MNLNLIHGYRLERVSLEAWKKRRGEAREGNGRGGEGRARQSEERNGNTGKGRRGENISFVEMPTSCTLNCYVTQQKES